MQLLIVGTGYVGLVAGTCFSEMGHQVLCFDLDQKKIDQLNTGHIPIYEKGLNELVQRNCAASRLHFTSDYHRAAHFGEVCFICVNTPVDAAGYADISRVKNVAQMLAEEMTGSKIIVNKTTAPVGTCDLLKLTIQEVLEKCGKNYSFSVVSNPEFLREGDAVADFMKPDRVIIGAEEAYVFDTMRKIYAPFMVNRTRILEMDTRSAEMVKYASNAMLATRISFMNEIALFCEEVSVDVRKVREGLGSDKRFGSNYLYPGIGFGGSCLPKDLRALKNHAMSVGCATPLMDAVLSVNQKQKELLYERLHSYFEGQLEQKTITLLGLSFKPDTNDIRDATSLTLIGKLLEAGAFVRVYDPVAMEPVKQLFLDEPNLIFCQDEEEAAILSDAMCLITEWKQFRLLNFDVILSLMRGRVFFDGRNQYDPYEMEKYGFEYYGIGVQAPSSTKKVLMK